MKHLAILFLLPLTLAGSACNQEDPGVGSASGTGGGTGGSGASAGSGGTSGTSGGGMSGTSGGGTSGTSGGGMGGGDGYYPLVDGASWTYLHTRVDLTTWSETVTAQAVTFAGAPAFDLVHSADPAGEVTVSTVARMGSKAMRVHKEISTGGSVITKVDYDPGFLRFDGAWSQVGVPVDWIYNRDEFDGAGNPVSSGSREKIYTLEETSVSVTVPAGTFDCVQIHRLRPDTGEERRYWFADGIGKVKDVNLTTGSKRELTGYSGL